MREVETEKNCREGGRGEIDLFLTANQFNNSVNGETRWVWDRINGRRGKPQVKLICCFFVDTDTVFRSWMHLIFFFQSCIFQIKIQLYLGTAIDTCTTVSKWPLSALPLFRDTYTKIIFQSLAFQHRSAFCQYLDRGKCSATAEHFDTIQRLGKTEREVPGKKMQ